MNDAEVIICIFAGLFVTFCVTGVVHLRRQRHLQMLSMIPNEKKIPSSERMV